MTYKEKEEIISKYENGTKNQELAKDYGVHHSTISNIIKQKEKIRNSIENLKAVAGSPNIKKLKLLTEEDEFETVVFKWLCQQRAAGIPVQGNILKEKAKYFWTKMHGSNQENESHDANKKEKMFEASNGWLDRFKHRHGLSTKKTKGEKMSADMEIAANFSKGFEKFLLEHNYDMENVYNADESGLEFKSIPQQTLALSTEKELSGHKPLKDRVTVMFCSNASGTHKIPLMIIGKSEKPRCFKNFSQLPIIYKAQKKGWINSEIFTYWYKEVFLPNILQKNPEGKYVL